jgi:peptidoglycan/xylan/chitin deacetylase (PgdA/CDA1 family)
MSLKKAIEIFALSFATCSLLLAICSPVLRMSSTKNEAEIQAVNIIRDTLPHIEIKEVTEQKKVEPLPKPKRTYTPYMEVMQKRTALIEQLTERYKNEEVHECSMQAKGVAHRVKLPPCDTCKTLFLTLDACILGYDSMLIEYLVVNNIKATLFVTARWINNNREAMRRLCRHPNLFDIENHGTLHRPTSVQGCTCYGIHGTANMSELVAEVEIGVDIIERFTNRRPQFFRSGTAFADNVAVAAIGDMGYRFIGFSASADEGATLPHSTVKQRILSAQHGDIVLMHFNVPNSESHLGFMMAFEEIKQKNICIKFEKLSDFSSELEVY